MERQLQAASSNAAKVDVLNAFSWEMKDSDPRRALALAEEAYQLAQADKYAKGVAYSLRNRSACCAMLSRYNEALTLSLEALEHLDALGDKEGKASVFSTLGVVYTDISDYEKALYYYDQSLKIYEQIGDKNGEMMTTMNIGSIYQQLGDFNHALGYFLESLSVNRTLENSSIEASALNHIGEVYMAMGKPNQALEYFEKSLAVAQTANLRHTETVAMLNLGKAYLAANDPENGLSYMMQSVQFARELGDRRIEAESLACIGSLYRGLNDFQKAELRYQQALNIAQEIGAKDLEYAYHLALSEIYETTGDFRQSLEHYKAFHQVKEAVFGEEASKRLRRIAIEREVEKAQREAELVRLRNLELAKANKALEEANQLKTELLSIAAHDLKNPLFSIMTFADMLLDPTSPASDKQTQFLSLIKDLAYRMHHIISDLLNSMSIESGRIKLNLHLFDLGQLSALMAAISTARAEQKGQTITTDIEQGCYVRADEERVKEVMDNLLSNAIKYSPHGRSIAVRVYRKEKWIVFEVKDEGLGFSADEKDKLFKRFQRLTAKPTGGESSTGLGLAIVKQLVEMHGGKVWAHSDGIGKGSTFAFELPAAEIE
ncbi:MAG: tetratricopeptide repeat protein [Chloroherpetonaceae bacterium]|nr:tetratricopeptide repeat protein [Chloroherpetonaceae bacterium]MDW8466979.1 tetratricopeptide repeat protein [Chloroherpetonaceae bacterium]